MSEPQSLSSLTMLCLWHLVVKGGSEWLSDLKPKLDSQIRSKLIKENLIEQTRERRKKGQRPVMRVSLTEHGWEYLRDHIKDHVNARSYTAADVLEGVLFSLGNFLDNNTNLGLASLFGSISQTPRTEVSVADIWNRIKDIETTLAEKAGYIKLSTLRKAFGDIPEDTMTRSLIDLQEQNQLVLYPFNEPGHITKEDIGAAIKLAGRDMHLLFIK